MGRGLSQIRFLLHAAGSRWAYALPQDGAGTSGCRAPHRLQHLRVGNQRTVEWGASVGGHLWRTTGDIFDSWESILEIGFRKQAGLHAYAGPGRWNDPDMLVVGMYGKGNVARGGCTDAEYRSHFALWCLLAAPLMIGCDVRNMNASTHQILLNREVLAVNQDKLGRQGYRVGQTYHEQEPTEVWAKPLADGSLAVGLFNLGKREHCLVTVAWESLGLHDRRPCLVRNLWTGADIGIHTREFSASIATHDALVLRLIPQY